MWSRDPSRRVALLGLLALAGCGLKPVYGPEGGGRKLFGKLRPRDPETPIDFVFNSRLAERLGPEDSPEYDLDYRISVGVVSQAITPDEVTTRYSLNGTADFVLTGPDGTEITRGRVSNFTSYSTTGTTVSTLSAEGDARQRLAIMLADQVVTRLLAASMRLPG
ncbi:LPS assembly lipoprotein LptE [Paracoccus zeaxanthinifaciens]|uniref:LPS assembly lipoprotein LptE n=1 Tax=Paracoccus zeaxanthinifaciens TaxID=187400 RepID=UPI0003B352FF|nr:LPS assembly lipoprotein LptE [Paracoccus zeaxanthinifaciens]